MNKSVRILLTLIAVILWTGFVGLGFINGYLLKPISKDGSAEGFVEAARKRISNEYVGNLAMLVIENGQVASSYFYVENQTIDAQSIFPVASVSKWVTSAAIHKLVENGKIDLDAPIDNYLTRWNLPSSDYDNSKVTVRNLLSHSSGLVDDLGYGGFDMDEEIQTIEESLTKAADSDYSDGVAIVGYEPGSQYMYSGAAYTILQLLIEEISGMSFAAYMQQEVFDPLGMTNSTFIIEDRSDLSHVSVYKTDGTTRPMKRFTALAAAGLMTTAEDLSKFMLAIASNTIFLSTETIQQMAKPVTYLGGTPYYGLGPKFYSQTDQDSQIIGHDGSGNDAINAATRLNLTTKNGIIVLETGNFSIASNIADEWLFTEAGIADFVVLMRNKSYLLTLGIIGNLLIILGSIVLYRRKK